MKAPEHAGPRFKAFTLIELLVVIAVIAMLAALLLPVLSRSKAEGQSTLCKNHLHQIGLAMEMYISDHNMYPPGLSGRDPFIWPDWLAPYNPVPWTNMAWQCPTYISEGGTVAWQLTRLKGGRIVWQASGSYAYNAEGMIGYKLTGKKYWGAGSPPLGLGELNLKVPDNRIAAPSDMYAVGDSRPIQYQNKSGFHAWIVMQPWKIFPSALHTSYTEARPPHAEGYNLLFTDGHVTLVKQRDYLYPPRTAQNWNRDHQPHPELWSPTNEWVIQG